MVLLALAPLAACGPDHRAHRGRAALERGDLAAAEQSFRGALERAPDHLEALYGLGWTLHLAGRSGAARAAFERCVTLDPASPLGHKGLGSVALAEENLPRARQHLEQALQYAPQDPAVLNSLALVHLKSGEPDVALGIYVRIREASTGAGDPALALGEGEALLRLDREEEALRVLEQALSAGSAPPRVEALLHALRARTLVALSVGRVDPSRCGETAAPVLAWLDEADRALERARTLAPEVAEVVAAQRLVLRRRHGVAERCTPMPDGS